MGKPITVRDMLVSPKLDTPPKGPVGVQMGPPMEIYREKFGIYHLKGGGPPPVGSQQHPNARSSFMKTAGRNYAVKMVTNWMGDNGWLHKVAWRLAFYRDEGRNMFPADWERPSYLLKVPCLKKQGKFMNTHGYVGDPAITKGYVCDKYVKDRAHYVDRVVWCETIEGDIWAECYTVVELPPRHSKIVTAKP